MSSETVSKIDAATSPDPPAGIPRSTAADDAAAAPSSSSHPEQSAAALEDDDDLSEPDAKEENAAASRQSFLTRLATSFKQAWGVKAMGRCFSCCSSSASAAAGSSDAKSDAASVVTTSTHQFSGLWYAPFLACCPCMNRCCCCSGLRVLSSSSSSSNSGSSSGDSSAAYRFLGGTEGGAAPAPITAEDDQNATGSIEMTELPGESSSSLGGRDLTLSSTKLTTSTPAKNEPKHPGLTLLAPLPLLPSASPDKVSQSLSPIAAPNHHVENAQILSQPKPVEKPPELIFTHHQIEANDALLLVPLHSQQTLEAELSAFYSDPTGTPPVQSDDALSGDDIDDELDLLSSDSDELDLDDSDDPLGMVKSNHAKDPKKLAAAQRAKSRALEETPAARRKREQQIAEKKRQLALEKERAEAQRLEAQRRAQAAAAEQARAAAAREAEIRERDRLRERDRERQRIKLEEAERKAEADKKAAEKAQAEAAAKVAEAETAAKLTKESNTAANAEAAAPAAAPSEDPAADPPASETSVSAESVAEAVAATSAEPAATLEHSTDSTVTPNIPAASEEPQSSSHVALEDMPSTPQQTHQYLDEEYVEEAGKPAVTRDEPTVDEESTKKVVVESTVVEPKENEAPVEKTDNIPQPSSVVDDADDDDIDADALIAELENLPQ